MIFYGSKTKQLIFMSNEQSISELRAKLDAKLEKINEHQSATSTLIKILRKRKGEGYWHPRY